MAPNHMGIITVDSYMYGVYPAQIFFKGIFDGRAGWDVVYFINFAEERAEGQCISVCRKHTLGLRASFLIVIKKPETNVQ